MSILALLMSNWHVYPAMGSMCPAVGGMKPAHLDLAIQLSQPMCDRTPLCEQAEYVLLGNPQVERCKANLCAEHHP